jgi:hypothetical protein
MYDVYTHHLGGEGNKELLIAKAVIERNETLLSAQLEHQPKYCRICHESNKYNAKFFMGRDFDQSLEGLKEVKEEEDKTKKELEELKA